MSGHSKWSTIRHKKGATDAKRAKVFARLSKIIIIAAQSGADPETNSSLRMAVDLARKENMPKDNIERAIKRGSGEGGEARMEEVLYEGMSVDNIPMLILCTTDNTNRTVSEIKNIFKKGDGKFVPSGSLSFQFEHCGIIGISTDDPDALELAAIDAGAQDSTREEQSNTVVIQTAPQDLHRIRELLESSDYTIDDARLIYKSTQPQTISPEITKRYTILYDALMEHDDVVDIFDTITSL